MAFALELFADLDDVLSEDHLFAADARGVAGRGEIAREDPHAVGRVRDDFGEGAVDKGDFGARGDLPDVDGLAHSAASARADRRQLISSSQLPASINSTHRR